MKDRRARNYLLAGILLLVATGIGGGFFPRDFFGAWLMAWIFWSGLAFGALAIFMTQVLTGGRWADLIRLPSLAAIGTLPILSVLFLPILIGARWLYPWMDRALFAAHDWPHKEIYLNWYFFSARSLVYLAVLSLLGMFLHRAVRSRRSDTLPMLSCLGLILLFVCMLFASTDWLMSLTPQWYSTIFPVIVLMGQVLTTLGFFVYLSCHDGSPERTPKQLHDLGNLLLAFVVFWGYVAISQWVLIWSGNLPREISWYLDRGTGGWQYVALALVLAQFFLPFFLLLSRSAKQDPGRLGRIAVLVLAAGVLDVFWLIKPALSPQHLSATLFDPLVFIGLGAVWLGAFRMQRQRLTQENRENV